MFTSTKCSKQATMASRNGAQDLYKETIAREKFIPIVSLSPVLLKWWSPAGEML